MCRGSRRGGRRDPTEDIARRGLLRSLSVKPALDDGGAEAGINSGCVMAFSSRCLSSTRFLRTELDPLFHRSARCHFRRRQDQRQPPRHKALSQTPTLSAGKKLRRDMLLGDARRTRPHCSLILAWRHRLKAQSLLQRHQRLGPKAPVRLQMKLPVSSSNAKAAAARSSAALRRLIIAISTSRAMRTLSHPQPRRSR